MERGSRRIAGPAAVVLASIACVATAIAAPPAGADAEPPVRYHTVRAFGPAFTAALRQRLGPDVLDEVLRLNRVDAAAVSRIDSLVLPEPSAGFVAPSPLPAHVAELDSMPKALVLSLRVQAFAAYEHGRLVRWGPVSSGTRDTPTLAGAYHVNWKLDRHRSTVDSSWVMPWTVNIDNDAGTALHEFELPGRPASHCCIRLMAPDARWVFEWVDPWRLDERGWRVIEPGTPVWIVGAYEFGSPRPWRRLPADPEADRIGADELSASIRAALAEGREKAP